MNLTRTPEIVRASLLLLSVLVFSCDSSSPKPDTLVLFRDSPFEDPSFFAGAPGSVVGPLTVQVLGPEIKGVPGRNGRRDPVEGIEVDFRFKFKLRKKNPYLEGMPFIPELLGRVAPEGDEGDAGVKALDADAPEGSGGNAGVKAPEADAPEGSGGDAGVKAPGADGKAPSFIPTFVAHQDFADPNRTIFEPEPEEDEPPIRNATVRTDEDGLARIYVKLGNFVGEYRVEAEVRTEYQQRRPLDFWIVSGLEILSVSPVEREGPTGSPVDIALRLYRQDGKATELDEGRAVLYSILGPHSDNASARLDDKKRTNSSGISAIKLHLGQRSAGPRARN